MRKVAKKPAGADRARRSFPLVYHAFEDALKAAGCAVCRVLHKEEERSLFSFLYEGMTNASAREKFVQGGGFCPAHFRAVLRLGLNRWSVGVVEIGTLCGQLVPYAAAEVREAEERAAPPGWRRMLGRNHAGRYRLFPGTACIFCREGRERERSSVEILETLVEDGAIAAAIERRGLCAPHAHLAMTRWQQPARRAWLGRIVAERAGILGRELREFLQKYDYRRQREPFGPEVDVVSRAVEFLAGTDDGEA